MMTDAQWLAWIAPAAWLGAGLLAVPRWLPGAAPGAMRRTMQGAMQGAMTDARQADRAWRAATLASLLALAGAAAWMAWSMLRALTAAGGPPADLPGATLSLLVALLGWVILRYSRRYLEGEAGQARYLASMCLTLAAVASVAATSHLGVLVLAWTASSLALHHLLTFYRDRPAAQVGAHKKFLASRLADACLVAALWLIHRETGTLSMPEIAAQLPRMAALPVALHAAAVLVALAAVLKSAQLPLHGWLIQVMEAPTPVSALLHAGVVNLGGFVLIRLATLLSVAPAAQAVLVVVGGSTALLAGLVMMTRVSVKVRLAWSTCAQMGFMLVECGLGLYELALLHLVAHSLYKAHAFLAAGDAVVEARSRDLAPARFDRQGGAAMLAVRFAAVPVAQAAVWASAAAWQAALAGFHLHPAALAIAGLGLAPLLWGAQDGLRLAALGLARVLVLAQLYLGWHLAFAAAVPAVAAPHPVLAGFAVLCIAALYGLQAWLPARPDGSLARALHPLAFAGFHLDERFTRLTFRIWPAARAAAAAARASTNASASAVRPIVVHGEH